MNFFSFLPRIGMSPIAKTLLLVGGLLAIVLPIGSVSGLFPLGLSDFIFLFVITSLFAAYRPGWALLLLVSVLPIEIIDLAPDTLGLGIRPYQFLTAAIFLGLGIRFVARREMPGMPRIAPADVLLALIPIGSLIAALNAPDPGASLRLSLILFSFYAIYILIRIYIRSSEDVSRVLPFFLLSAGITALIAILQNVLFLLGTESYEVMPGRPNALFAEADWLGMFLVLFATVLLVSMYRFARDKAPTGSILSMKRSTYLILGLVLCLTALILSVSRSAWLGMIVTIIILSVLPATRGMARPAILPLTVFILSGIVALVIAFRVPLTNFDLSGRAESIGSGAQTITISCQDMTALPERIGSVAELAPLGCRHINLEEIPIELDAGRFVAEIDRDDPNVSIRRDIYFRSIDEIRAHPILGIGWGSITRSLGTDPSGTGLNASNVFLEVWLGSGLLGLIGLLGTFGYLAFVASRDFFRNGGSFPLFLISAFAGLVVFDLFNSGILLGFFWVLLGIAGSYLSREEPFTDTL